MVGRGAKTSQLVGINGWGTQKSLRATSVSWLRKLGRVSFWRLMCLTPTTCITYTMISLSCVRRGRSVEFKSWFLICSTRSMSITLQLLIKVSNMGWLWIRSVKRLSLTKVHGWHHTSSSTPNFEPGLRTIARKDS